MNTRNPIVWFRRLALLLAIMVLATGVLSAEFRLGAAAVPIIPPIGITLAGYYHERASEGMLDDIFAKATVLVDTQTRWQAARSRNASDHDWTRSSMGGVAR